ncbi:Glu/Leu/Phe/Val dehydrogenase dimerization domain-containing protein [Paucibacter sp. APW11]|uniref:Glu/Leu/Phe/Val dehydrogenase dimerization domain-containing protein n=1 Tax=Roseateles aquae TaxID=3077235 RepID=A0ABU3P8K8_9BURK|nr:Glu/Leu/Phe/Val dehydrogenase dimerization domain-containing protein [Paucibacter sp. APW11]MDT8998905.1 Glu/Leu/Phe/Val dehydrogenase dimerization domain-containing protein [Paucibacter sp. APW11]
MTTSSLARALQEAPESIPSSLFGLPDQAAHERVLFATDEQTGLKTILAVHSTARGPAFGGCRFWSYGNELAALNDALRLAQGMSLKNALANLPFGGGKAVILKPAGEFDRTALFAAFGRAVASLNGAYITAEDVGTTTGDMRIVQQHTQFVSGIPRDGAFGGDPSPKTAWGVFVSIEAGVRLHLKRDTLEGVRVAVQGLGAVGWHLAEFLHKAGAKLLVADVDAAKVARAQELFGAQAVHVNEILAADVDVLAPCALGAVLNAGTVPQIRAKLVAGAANNQLATAADGDTLHGRGVLYLPDYLVNAGGIVSVAREFRNEGEESAVMAEVSQIRDRVAELLDRIRVSGNTPAREADAWARSKLVAG